MSWASEAAQQALGCRMDKRHHDGRLAPCGATPAPHKIRKYYFCDAHRAEMEVHCAPLIAREAEEREWRRGAKLLDRAFAPAALLAAPPPGVVLYDGGLPVDPKDDTLVERLLRLAAERHGWRNSDILPPTDLDRVRLAEGADTEFTAAEDR